MNRALCAGILWMLISVVGCKPEVKHEVEIKPINIEVKPVHITLDVNIKLDKELDDAFGFEDVSEPESTQIDVPK